VKVQVIRTGDLQPGELRSHLYFRAIPKNKPLGAEETPKDSTISISIVPIFGISIPAIIRVGESDSKITISDTKFEFLHDTIPNLRFTFHRTGNMSVYGDVSVKHISPEGKETEVGFVKGLAVYTPNASRKCQLLLDKAKQVNFHSGSLHLSYVEQGITRKNNLAETNILLH
jgi:hypothetical protein